MFPCGVIYCIALAYIYTATLESVFLRSKR